MATKDILEASNKLLRKKNAELQKNLKHETTARRALEKNEALKDAKVEGSDRKFGVLYYAVDMLAAVVPSNTQEGRQARQVARQMMASCGVKPPTSLGSPRKAPKRKKRAKKKAKKRAKSKWRRVPKTA